MPKYPVGLPTRIIHGNYGFGFALKKRKNKPPKLSRVNRNKYQPKLGSRAMLFFSNNGKPLTRAMMAPARKKRDAIMDAIRERQKAGKE